MPVIRLLIAADYAKTQTPHRTSAREAQKPQKHTSYYQAACSTLPAEDLRENCKAHGVVNDSAKKHVEKQIKLYINHSELLTKTL